MPFYGVGKAGRLQPTGLKRGKANMLKNLFPFMDTDGGAGTGAQDITEQKAQQYDGSGTVHTEADEPKTGEGVKSEAQRIADAMVAKKLKNMPSKEELAAFRKWQDEQKTETERLSEVQRKADEAIMEAERRENKANAMMAAAKAGLKAEHIEDAVILALAKSGDEVSIEETIESIAKNNPSWRTGGAELPKGGSNPATEASGELFKIKRYF